MAQNDQVTCVLELQEGKPDRKVYSITDAGRGALGEWFEQPTAHLTVRDGSAKLMACAVRYLDLYRVQLAFELVEESRKLVSHYKGLKQLTTQHHQR